MLDLIRLAAVFVATPLVLATVGWLLTKSEVKPSPGTSLAMRLLSRRRDDLGLGLLFLHLEMLVGFSVAVGVPRISDVTHAFFWMSLAGIFCAGLGWLGARQGSSVHVSLRLIGPAAVCGVTLFVLIGLGRLEVDTSAKVSALLPFASALAVLVQAGNVGVGSKALKSQWKRGPTWAVGGQVICWIVLSAQTSSVFFWLMSLASLTGVVVACWTCPRHWRTVLVWGNWYLGAVASMAVVLGYHDNMWPVMAAIFAGVIMSIIFSIISLAQRWKSAKGQLASRSLATVFMSGIFMAGCTPLQPNEGARNQSPTESQVNVMKFQLAGAALRSLIDDGAQVHVQVVKLVQNADGTESLGDKEGTERVAKLTSDSQDFLIDQLEVGRKEIQISIVSSLEDQVGYGALRVSIGLGVNEILDPLMIKLIPFELRRRDWDAGLDVTFVTQGHENEVVYSEVKDVIDRKCANSCHNAAAFKGALDLSTFPFRSDNLATQEDIVKESLLAIVDLTYPMPPRPEARIPAEEQASIQAWADSGLPTKHSTADQYNALVERVSLKWVMQGTPSQSGQLDLVKSGDMRFGTSMRSMQIGGKYDVSVLVLGPSGVVLKEETFPNLLLRGKGAFERAIRINYVPPTLRVPIIVSP